MNKDSHELRPFLLASGCLFAFLVWLIAPGGAARAQAGTSSGEVTFTKDIAPILQKHCQTCHRPNGGGPMSLITYEGTRPWARAINDRTHRGPRAGVMPPWYVEKNIGIQKFLDDPSLSQDELDKIEKWVSSGAPRGNPADMPPAVAYQDQDHWEIGTPDLIVKSAELTVPAVSGDTWGTFPDMPTGLTEDRYVQAVEVREVNDLPAESEAKTVGGRWVFHHVTYDGVSPTGTTPFHTHEIGQNKDLFPPTAGRLLAANSVLSVTSLHMHSNGRETKAHVEFGFKFFPKGYKPAHTFFRAGPSSGIDIDSQPNAKGELHAYVTLKDNLKMYTFEPHMHAPGVRACLEAIWGAHIQQLSCVGYDHNWVKQYQYAEGSEPLLPRGTILHFIGWIDTTSGNKNVADPRNWTGSGRRSIANMFINDGLSIPLTDEEFQAEMAKRREVLKTRNNYDIGCPLCWAPPLMPATTATGQGAN